MLVKRNPLEESQVGLSYKINRHNAEKAPFLREVDSGLCFTLLLCPRNRGGETRWRSALHQPHVGVPPSTLRRDAATQCLDKSHGADERACIFSTLLSLPSCKVSHVLRLWCFVSTFPLVVSLDLKHGCAQLLRWVAQSKPSCTRP